MNDGISTLVRSMFQKESLNDCSVEELQTVARQYPYFTPVQFLLAQKLKSADENLYKEQLHKLSLYFNNPLWLDYLLNGFESKPVIEPDSEVRSDISNRTEKKELVASPQVETVESFVTEPTTAEAEHETILPIEGNMESADHTIVSEEEIVKPDFEESVGVDVETEIMQPSEETIEEVKTDSNAELVSDNEEERIEILNEESQDNLPADEPSHAETEGAELPPIRLPQIHQSSETELTFQPYHTVDYFASQGIKYNTEEKPTDRFGQQLKSFTEWLKTLKRLPETEATRPPDAVSEEKVQQLADHSIVEGQVVTETMADVWLKQGNKEKAIETYNKLSLLNPSKSAYFASLIEQIKNS